MSPFLYAMIVTVGLLCVGAQDDLDYMLKSSMEQFVEENKQMLDNGDGLQIESPSSEPPVHSCADRQFTETADYQNKKVADGSRVQVLRKLNDFLQSREIVEMVLKAGDILKTEKVDLLSRFALSDLNQMLDLSVEQMEKLVREGGKMIDVKWVFALKSYLGN